MKKTFEIIDPQEILQEQRLLGELTRFGIDHLNPIPDTGWHYVLDHCWIVKKISQFIQTSTKKDLICMDIGCGRSPFDSFLENYFGINIIGIDRAVGFCQQSLPAHIDYVGDFQNFNGFEENSVDLIIWISSLEHNQLSTIKKLYNKSLNLLKPDGLFLATLPFSEKTYWFESAEQTNLSLDVIINIFGDLEVVGDIDKVKRDYQNNVLYLKERYQNRFNDLNEDFIRYVTSGISIKKPIPQDDRLIIKQDKEDPFILFMPSNDTHVQWMLPIAKGLDHFQFMVIPDINENADKVLQKNEIGYWHYSPEKLSYLSISIIVLGNDWGPYERDIIALSKLLSIRTICIQEGPLHFSKELNHLCNAEVAFIQGSVFSQYLRCDSFIITGNPKYDQYQKLPLPEKQCVMINCNFTYGVYEEHRLSWIKDAVNVCKSLGVDYFISQHPRDKGELPEDYNIIKSNAFLVKEQIEQSSILISRFSTLMYEALLLGRQVVYYDPMNERFKLIKENNNGAIPYSSDVGSLMKSVEKCLTNPVDSEVIEEFLALHCHNHRISSVEACITAIKQQSNHYFGNNQGPRKLLDYALQLSKNRRLPDNLQNNKLEMLISEINKKDTELFTLKQEIDELKESLLIRMALKLRYRHLKIKEKNGFLYRVFHKPYYNLLGKIKEYTLRRNEKLVGSSGLFDAAWYLNNNPDVANANIDPLRHFIMYGGLEGRDPSPEFCSQWYLDTYQDVQKAQVNPLIHFLRSSKKENRLPCPPHK